MSNAVRYDTRGSEDFRPVIMVEIVKTVVIPEVV